MIGGGAILTESVYNLHGSASSRPTRSGASTSRVILVVAMFGAFAVVILAAIVDIFYAYLDPRIRLPDERRDSLRCGHQGDAEGPLLEIQDLRVSFATEEGVVHAVDGVSFTVGRRRGRGDRGRVGLGQVGHGDDADGSDARAQRALRGQAMFDGNDLVTLPTTSCARSAAPGSRWSSRTR